uniref:beta-N-acetylhexosaminidase n=1 Tax=Amblyomma aureolatum TaxID=187763 RepID=A0A1E1X7S4_9ACAR
MAPMKIRLLKLIAAVILIAFVILYWQSTRTVDRTPVETVQWVADVLTDPPPTASAPHANFQDTLRVPPIQFDERIVHFDLKGAPPKLEYYDAVFPLLRRLGATGLLMEYEDMFPYTGVLSPLAASNAYKEAEIVHILASAHANQLQVVPLVQTFGHLEFALKLPEFADLRELSHSPQALCPTLNASLALVKAMLDQVLHLHPNAQYVHIGCDEVYSLGQCARCERRMGTANITKDKLFLEHVEKVVAHVAQYGVRPIMWDDMLRGMEAEEVQRWGATHPVDLMVWQYSPNISKHLEDQHWLKYARFQGLWIASAFKGATGPKQLLPDTKYHLRNHHSWLETLNNHRELLNIRGIALTGWQRYDHFATLCELLPASLPSLAANMVYLQHGCLDEPQLSQIRELLQCNRQLPLFDDAGSHLLFCQFPGAKVLTGVQQLVTLYNQKKIMEKNSHYVGWLDSYQVRLSFVSPDHIIAATKNLTELLSTSNHLHKYLGDALTQLYDAHTTVEWIGTFLDPLHAELTLLEQQVQRLLNYSNWPRRPLERAT